MRGYCTGKTCQNLLGLWFASGTRASRAYANPPLNKCTDQSNEQVYHFASETSFLIEIERQIFRDLSSTRMDGHRLRTKAEALLLEEILEVRMYASATHKITQLLLLLLI